MSNTGMDLDLSEVLAQSRATTARLQATATKGRADSIPRLERALPQIDLESRRLAPMSIDEVGVEDRSAGLRLLSQHGVDTRRIEKSLQHPALLADGCVAPIAETDLESHVVAGHEAAVVAAVSSALQRIQNASLASVSAALEADWEASKRELISLPSLQLRSVRSTALQGAYSSRKGPFALTTQQADVAAATPATPKPLSLTPSRSLPRFSSPGRKQSPIESAYNRIVSRAVYSRASPTNAVAVATEFDDAVVATLAPRGDITLAPKNIQYLHAVFTALRYMSREASHDSGLAPPENAFGGMHEPSDRRTLVLGALRYLSLQFREEKMRREVEARPRDAHRGGIPGLIGDVRAYLNLTFDRGIPQQLEAGPCVAGLPMWPQVYFCLRAGDPRAALEILKATLDESATTSSSVYLYCQCLEAYVESGDRRTMSDDLLLRLVHDYGISVYRGMDNYQRACYVVLARLDPSAGDKMSLHDEDYALLFYSIEDYLWLRLNVARLEGDSAPPGSLVVYGLSLADVQNEIVEFGSSHFDERGDTPLFYTLILILCGEFSAAIDYLQSEAHAISEAMHIAFVLHYYGMIFSYENSIVLAKSGAMQIGSAKPSRSHLRTDGQADAAGSVIENRLHVPYDKLLWRYVSEFAGEDATTAALYVFTIRDISLRTRYLEDLILETRAYDVLLGDGPITAPGRTRGLLEELWPLGGIDAGLEGNDFVALVSAAASAAERRGDRDAAALLFDVAGETDKVADIVMSRLSAELTSRGSQARERALLDAKGYQMRIKSRLDSGSSPTVLRSLDAVVTMAAFYDALWDGEVERAWSLVTSLGILPSTDGAIAMKVRESEPSSGLWTEAVCDRIPDLVVNSMECLAGLHAKGVADTRIHDNVQQSSNDPVRHAARVLVNFAGMLRNATADMSARLIRLEVLMS